VEPYVLLGGLEGYDRLRLLASIRRPDTAEMFRLAGVRPMAVTRPSGAS